MGESKPKRNRDTNMTHQSREKLLKAKKALVESDMLKITRKILKNREQYFHSKVLGGKSSSFNFKISNSKKELNL